MTDSGACSSQKRILAVASGGGHWVQLMRVRPALLGHKVTFVTTLAGYEDDVAPARIFRVRDGSRWNRLHLLLMLIQILIVVLRVRPQIVISTGAAPGYFAVRFGKLVGARAIWLDSIANAEEVSLSGQMAGRHVDLYLTQWPELASPEGPEFAGAVL